jgi:predicted nucleic acid-binding protein
MILFDTSVIIDLRDSKSPFHDWAADQVSNAVSSEGAAVNSVCVAETAVRADKPDTVPLLLAGMGFNLLDLPISSAVPAAKAYAVYLDRRKAEVGTAPKTPLPDFLIGAHAQAEHMTLVTRDPTRVRKYFPDVSLITPD